jgi:tripartite-type tricarboxylate transporter receptor subunit TctC
MMKNATRTSGAKIVIIALLGATSVLGQTFPSRPVTILNGFPAGGSIDTVLRQIAARLELRLGQPVVVDNRPGASGTIAAATVARSNPDGYTLLFGVAANLAVAPTTMKTPPYDPSRAFTPVIEIARGPYIWLVRADAPAKSFLEFVAWTKGNPGKLNYGSPGLGSVHHLAAEVLKRSAGIDIVHVPYRGASFQPLLAGEIQASFENMPGPLPFIESGKIRALAVTGTRRLPALPDVPTFAELGLPANNAQFWWGIVGPAGMPKSVVDRLNGEVALALADPGLKAMFANWNIAQTPGTPEAFGTYIAQEYARWKEVAATTDLKLE